MAILTAGKLNGQATGRILGTVSDSTARLPIAGVRVSIGPTATGNTYSAVTDSAGMYTITGVPVGMQTVTASRIGYGIARRTLVIDSVSEAHVDFVLASAAISLEEVVVTGALPPSQTRGGIVVLDTARSQVVAAAAGVATGVSARMAGVTASAAVAVLRAPASDPLYVIDGVMISGAQLRGDTSGSAVQRLYSSNAIDPLQIETIDVIKGAAAATIYGSHAANGVITIQTKRGPRSRSEAAAARNRLVRARTLEQIELAMERETDRIRRGDSLASLDPDSTKKFLLGMSVPKPPKLSEVQKFIRRYNLLTRGHNEFLKKQADVIAEHGRTGHERVRRAYIGRAERLSGHAGRAEVLIGNPGVTDEEKNDLASAKVVGTAQEAVIRGEIQKLQPGAIGSGLLPVPLGSWVEATCFWREAQPTFLPGLNLTAGDDRAAVGANVVDGFLGGVRASFGVGMAASDQLDSIKANLHRLVSAGGSFVFGFSYPFLHLAPGKISCDPKDNISRNSGFDVLLWPRFGFDAPIAGTQVASGVWNADLGAEINAYAGTREREIVFFGHLRAGIVDGPTEFHRTIGRTTASAFTYVQASLGAEVADVLRIQYRWPVAAPAELKDLLTSFVSFSISPRVTGRNP